MRIAICEDEEFIQNSIEKNVEKCLEITGIDQLSQIYYSYSELFRGLSENPQEDYEKMMQEMEAAGINAITEEVNNQLDQWYNTVR